MRGTISLTKKRQRANKFRPTGALHGSPLNHNASDAERYYQDLRAMVRAMTAETLKDIMSVVVKDGFAQDVLSPEQKRMKNLNKQLKKKFIKLFEDKSTNIITNMLGRSEKSSAAGLRMSIKKLTGGLTLETSKLTPEILDVLKVATKKNADLIKSIPKKYLDEVQAATYKSITEGRGFQDLLPEIRRIGKQAEKRSRVIAIDQTKKAFEELNFNRMKFAGIEKFEWVHTRSSFIHDPIHLALDGKIFSFDNLPVIDIKGTKGKPGDRIGCTCIMAPVIEFKSGKVI